MARLAPLSPAAVPDLAPVLEAGRKIMGFLPNDGLTMARRPALLRAVLGLVEAVYAPGEVDAGFKRLLGEVASRAAGCRYCEAHAANGAARNGIDAARLAAVWTFDRSELFSPAERAALRLALAAGQVPNAVTDESFAELRRHWTDDQIVELLGVLSLYGFLNRWNATLNTDLEAYFTGP